MEFCSLAWAASELLCYAKFYVGKIPRIHIGGVPLERAVVLKWFYSLSRRKTFVGGKCTLPNALLVFRLIYHMLSGNRIPKLSNDTIFNDFEWPTSYTSRFQRQSVARPLCDSLAFCLLGVTSHQFVATENYDERGGKSKTGMPRTSKTFKRVYPALLFTKSCVNAVGLYGYLL